MKNRNLKKRRPSQYEYFLDALLDEINSYNDTPIMNKEAVNKLKRRAILQEIAHLNKAIEILAPLKDENRELKRQIENLSNNLITQSKELTTLQHHYYQITTLISLLKDKKGFTFTC